MELQPIELQGIRVLTTRQIADCYGTNIKVINNNFARNKSRYVIGRHYFYLDSEEICKLKTNPQIEGQLKHTSKAIFWTEKGALLHAKSLNTDKAWEVYDYLVDFYFRAKERQQALERQMEERGELVVDAPENIRIIEAANRVKDDLICVRVLLEQCSQFISREEYDRRVRQTVEAVEIIKRDMIQMSAIAPRAVRKAI